LARDAEVTAPWLSRVERGHVWPSRDLMRKLATTLDVPPKELLERSELLQKREKDEAGRRIWERLNNAFGKPQQPEGKETSARDRSPELPPTITSLDNKSDVAALMVTLVAKAAERTPGADPAGESNPKESIVVCRYSADDILRYDSGVLQKWDWQLQRCLQRGWHVDHVRSAAAWVEEMRYKADTLEVGGALSLLSRVGFPGMYRPYSVPASSDRAARFNLVDVPREGTLMFRAEGSGCFIPAGAEFSPLRATLREDSLRLARYDRPLVSQFDSTRPGSWDARVQQKYEEIESLVGDQIHVKNGFNISLEHPILRSRVLERLLQDGHIEVHEKDALERSHRRRRELFAKQVLSSKVLDICPRESLVNLARTGKFQPDSEEEPDPRSPEDCATLFELVAGILVDHPDSYSLAIVDSNPFDVRCEAKDSYPPVVYVEVKRSGSSKATWAEIQEPTFCGSLMTHLRTWHAQHARNRDEVRKELLLLAKQARARTHARTRPVRPHRQ
jgi:transcriptional regulator with XRE-family HTH domain